MRRRPAYEWRRLVGPSSPALASSLPISVLAGGWGEAGSGGTAGEAACGGSTALRSWTTHAADAHRGRQPAFREEQSARCRPGPTCAGPPPTRAGPWPPACAPPPAAAGTPASAGGGTRSMRRHAVETWAACTHSHSLSIAPADWAIRSSLRHAAAPPRSARAHATARGCGPPAHCPTCGARWPARPAWSTWGAGRGGGWEVGEAAGWVGGGSGGGRVDWPLGCREGGRAGPARRVPALARRGPDPPPQLLTS